LLESSGTGRSRRWCSASVPRKDRNTELGMLVSIPQLTTTECRQLRRSPIAAQRVRTTYRPRRRRAAALRQFGQAVLRLQALGSKAWVTRRSLLRALRTYCISVHRFLEAGVFRQTEASGLAIVIGELARSQTTLRWRGRFEG